MRSTGIATKGADASGPPCERSNALGVVEEVHDTFETAGFHFAGCLRLPPHPGLVRLHLLVVRFGFGSATGEVRPHRADESSLLQTGLTGNDGLDAGCFVTVVNRLDPLCDLRVTFIHHLDGVGPTRPMNLSFVALRSPKPPVASGSDAVIFTE